MKRLTGISILIIFSLALSVAAFAESSGAKDEPVLLDIDIEYMQSIIGNKDIFIYDVRPETFYERGHLPGAVSVPYEWDSHGAIASRTGSFDTSKLPADKRASIIFYSEGPSRLKSFKAFRAAIDAVLMGYMNVMYFGGGYTAWAKFDGPKDVQITAISQEVAHVAR